MIQYPTISTKLVNTNIMAFDKLDGSNIRVEWNRKTGFSKFGTRTRLLDANDPMFGEAIPLFWDTLANPLEKKFKKDKLEKITLFMEFYGENSFAGQHEDEDHQLTLFDAYLYKRGMMTPKVFLNNFENIVPTPKVLYEGKLSQELIKSVRNSTLEGMTFEGVVCKGAYNSRGEVITFKIKSEAWLNKLKDKYGYNSAMYNKLK